MGTVFQKGKSKGLGQRQSEQRERSHCQHKISAWQGDDDEEGPVDAPHLLTARVLRDFMLIILHLQTVDFIDFSLTSGDAEFHHCWIFFLEIKEQLSVTYKQSRFSFSVRPPANDTFP